MVFFNSYRRMLHSINPSNKACNSAAVAFCSRNSRGMLSFLSSGDLQHLRTAAFRSYSGYQSLLRSHRGSFGAPTTPLTYAFCFHATEAGGFQGLSDGVEKTWAGHHEAEALLRERFGPQAKLVIRHCSRRQIRRAAAEVQDPNGEEDEEDVMEDENPALGTTTRSACDEGEQPLCSSSRVDSGGCRASATCRLLGFPVELAAVSGQQVEEVLGRVLREALGSDVTFIPPQSKGSASSLSSSHSARGHGRGRGRGKQRRDGYGQHNGGHTLSPRQMEFKAIIEELRELCLHFSRVLKFSIKRPQERSNRKPQSQEWGDDEAATQRGEWRCRAYVRDEWGIAPNLSFTAEVCGQSPNDCLMQCFAMLRDRYRAELESPSVQLENVREVEAFVHPWGKMVESYCFEENTEDEASKQNGSRKKKRVTETSTTNGSDAMQEDTTEPVSVEEQYRVIRPTTFTAAIIIEDAQGNVSVNQVKRQATPLVAYQNASAQALRSEASLSPNATVMDQCIPLPPLLHRMRWQFEAMVHRLAKQLGKSVEDFASIRIEGDASVICKDEKVSKEICDATRTDKQSFFFTASFVSDGSVVWQQSGQGRYRLEFECYVQALTYLLDQYPDVGRMCFDSQGGGVLFPTTQLLELSVLKHENYNVAANHRGKWNVYALLGTLTSQLLGSFYQTTYHEDHTTGEWRATLTVNDGACSKQLLIQRQAKKRGEAWRNACLDALRENFPNQYRDALMLHPDIDLSGDTMARGSKFRALPREKRVEHMGNLFSLVAAFAEEDLGWHNLRVRLRNASCDLGLPQWVAEMEAQVEGEEQRRVVAVSPPYAQVKHARRVLVYQLAQKYFPKELEAYANLNRGDALNPDQDARNADNMVYRAGTESFVNQVMMLLEERASSMAPFTWVLEQHDVDTEGSGNDGSVECLLRPFSPRFRAAVYGQRGDLLVSERIGEENESAVGVLCSVLRAATNRLAGDKGEQLWTEYECHTPPPVSTSRELSLYMFNAFFGISRIGTTDSTNALSSPVEQQVVEIDTRELGGYWFATMTLSRVGGLAAVRAIAMTKREAFRDVLLLACRKSFPRALQYLSAHSREASSFAAEVFSAPVVEVLPDAVLRDIQQGLERAEVAVPPRPYTLLRRCITREFRNERWLRVEQIPNSGTGFQCRIYLQKHRREAKKGEVQIVGFGSALSRAQALHIASVCALENLFETDLADAVARLPTYKDLPPLE